MRMRLLVVSQLLWLSAACGGAAPDETSEPSRGGSVAEGELLIEKGDFEGAKAVFEGIVAKQPDNAKAHYYLGLAKRNLGDSDGAVKHYESAVNLDAKLMNAHINLGLLMLEKGDFDRAESELAIYLEASPDDADAHFNFGLVMEAKGDAAKAREHYEKAMSLNPEDASPLFGLGDLERSAGNLKAALEWYRKAKALDPEMPELAFIEGQTLLEMKKKDEACLAFYRLTEMSDLDRILISKAGQLIAQKDPDCAIKLYKGAISADDSFAAAHFYLANTLAREKQFEEAKTHYERFLEIAPPDDPAAEQAKKRIEGCNKALSK
jgi:tetratricopeptide (TPR) repeat protein